MTKKRTIKKQGVTFKKKYVLWIVILILIALQCLSAWHIMKLREYADSNSDFTMSILLKNAEEERYKYPIIDIAENRVYIPEARIYLPLDETSRNMRYDYREKGAGFWPKALYFSVSSVVGQQSGAQYESCDKMIILAPPTEVREGGVKATGTIEPTRDGLSEIFMNSDDACWDQKWYTDQKQNLVEVVNQAKNY
jgi:hypothetical protein